MMCLKLEVYLYQSTSTKMVCPGLQIRAHTGKVFFLFLIICCGYSKDMFKLMGNEINAVLGAQTILIRTYGVPLLFGLNFFTHMYDFSFCL